MGAVGFSIHCSQSKKQVDKVGQKEGLTGLAPLELRKFEDPDAENDELTYPATFH